MDLGTLIHKSRIIQPKSQTQQTETTFQICFSQRLQNSGTLTSKPQEAQESNLEVDLLDPP